MSKVTDQFREHLWVMNDVEYLRRAGTGRVFVNYLPGGDALTGVPSWVVKGVGFDTDPESNSGYGSRHFAVPSRDMRAEVLERALAWAGARFDVTAWEKSPFGAWVPAGTLAVMNTKLMAAKADPALKCYATSVARRPGWVDRRGPVINTKPVDVWVAARTRPAAVGFLADLGVTVDPADLGLIHPDRLKGMVEGQVGANLGVAGGTVLRPD